jgi:hypothetical protein
MGPGEKLAAIVIGTKSLAVLRHHASSLALAQGLE